MKRKALTIAISIAMIILSLPIMAFGADEEPAKEKTVYFQFAGIDVTDENKSNIVADLSSGSHAKGSASYNSSTGTLTLKNFKIQFDGKYYDEEAEKNDQSYCIDSHIPMKIVIKGEVEFNGFSDPIRFFVHNDPDFDSKGDVSITGDGRLTLTAGQHTNTSCEGMSITLDDGDIDISCRELLFNGFYRSADFDANTCTITSNVIRSTGDGAGCMQLNSKKTIFDGCEEVTIESQEDGLLQNILSRDSITFNNCKNVNISAVGRSIYAKGDVIINNSTLVAKSGYRCVDIEDGELVIQGQQSDVYIKGGDKEIVPDPYLNPEDKIYGVYIDNEDNKGIRVNGGTLRITGREGAVYSEEGELKLALADDCSALGSTEEDTFNDLHPIVLEDKTAKVDSRLAKSIMCQTIYSLDDCIIDSIPAQKYTGKEIKPEVKITMEGLPLVAGKDFTVEYKDNIEPGQATAVITGIGNYEGTAAVSFEIVKKSGPADDTDDAAKTGDSGNILFYGLTTITALLGAGFILALRRKEER